MLRVSVWVCAKDFNMCFNQIRRTLFIWANGDPEHSHKRHCILKGRLIQRRQCSSSAEQWHGSLSVTVVKVFRNLDACQPIAALVRLTKNNASPNPSIKLSPGHCRRVLLHCSRRPVVIEPDTLLFIVRIQVDLVCIELLHSFHTMHLEALHGQSWCWQRRW